MILMRDIRAFARRIAKEFRPKRITLFGSYAYGKPTESSDVDLLVELPFEGHPARLAAKILTQLDPPFAVDLIVRSPHDVTRRVALGDWSSAGRELRARTARSFRGSGSVIGDSR